MGGGNAGIGEVYGRMHWYEAAQSKEARVRHTCRGKDGDVFQIRRSSTGYIWVVPSSDLIVLLRHGGTRARSSGSPELYGPIESLGLEFFRCLTRELKGCYSIRVDRAELVPVFIYVFRGLMV